MSLWLTINLAPKDGTMVDLWVIDGRRKHRMTDCYWSFARDEKGNALQDGAWDGWCCDTGQSGPSGFNPYPNLIRGKPTHYMPRPSPPVERTDDQ